VRLRSAGFEIEAELAGEAVARRLRVVEVPVAYRPRIAGTASKLRALRDGAASGDDRRAELPAPPLAAAAAGRRGDGPGARVAWSLGG
jgi:hypothetical protein